MLPDGTKVEPRRTAGGYRRFTLAMLEDIALSSYRRRWFRMDDLKSTYRELLIAAHRDTGEYKIPGSAFSRQLRDRVKLWTAYSGEFSPDNLPHGRVQ